ncbi:threonylcarbamoyl-AMP synthase [Lactobacillus sp. PV037]|uniref:L-threonylcarbamoyladenylate synthase n=1 Tax=Lactobacillus sp. PV037 TaxID=2594496 RepID=UPI00224077EC|nr:L-threonylcarbamoyladenylate synthase [Lactobacillus sp. PV037]QNQ83385.1 threonylcarbamoyl-AMP synthase [Lactobacillus sp. PV037]
METKIFSKDQLDDAVKLLKRGELVAFPTETVYGLGALATDEVAVKNVYAAKGRPSDNPLIVTVSNPEMMARYVTQIPEVAEKLINQFWPGPLTIILKVKEGALPNAVTGGLTTAAFRNPQDKLTQELISKLDAPIVGPSANTSTKPSPTTAEHVFHDLNGKIAGIVDNGPTEIGLESTIIDLSVETPVVLRPGEITPEQLSEALGQAVLMNKGTTQTKGVPKAPGMKYRHYAPSAPVYIVDDVKDFEKIVYNNQVGVAALSNVLKNIEANNTFNLGENIDEAAHNLFGALRYFDEQKNIKKIYVQGFQQGDISAAYMNRLTKAAAGHHYFNK